MDKKTFIGLTVILFLIASWSVGNMMFLSPEADNGAEAELPGYFIWILLISFLLLFIVLIYRSRSTSMFAAILVVTSPWIASYFILRFRPLFTGFLIGIILLSIILVWKGIGRKTVMAGLAVFGVAVFLTELYDYFYGDENGVWYSEIYSGEEAPELLPWDDPGALAETVFGSWGTFLLLLLIVAVLVIILFQKVKPIIDSGKDEEIEEDLTSAVDKTITELHEGKDVESTILRCYQRMCMILEEKGVKYSDFLTPREFERRAITYLDVPRDKIFDLRDLFEMAKYSDHKLGDEDRERAVKSLKALRDEMR